PVARRGGESKGGDGIESLKDVALASDESAAKGGIEVMLLDDIPGEEIDGLGVAVFYIEVLSETIFEFVGVGKRGVAVEADEIGEVVHAGDVAIGDERRDGVLIAVARARAVEKTLQRGRAEFDGKFAGVVGDGFTAEGSDRA